MGVRGCSRGAAHFLRQRMQLHGRTAGPIAPPVCRCGSPAVCLLCPPFLLCLLTLLWLFCARVPPTPRRQEMRLSIGGLEVRPGVWRKAFDEGGYDSDAGEDREAGVVLGYVAQVSRQQPLPAHDCLSTRLRGTSCAADPLVLLLLTRCCCRYF